MKRHRQHSWMLVAALLLPLLLLSCAGNRRPPNPGPDADPLVRVDNSLLERVGPVRVGPAKTSLYVMIRAVSVDGGAYTIETDLSSGQVGYAEMMGAAVQEAGVRWTSVKVSAADGETLYEVRAQNHEPTRN